MVHGSEAKEKGWHPIKKLDRHKKDKLGWCVMGVTLSMVAVILLWPNGTAPVPIPDDLYQKLKWEGESVVVINPRMTAAAYSENGFYYYYDGRCDESCLHIPLNPGMMSHAGAFNYDLVRTFQQLRYLNIDDNVLQEELLKNPDMLDFYDHVIVLHSEYVTQEIFDALQKHRNVIYMSPNALYAKVTYENGTLSLVRGHGYPEQSIGNGFGWIHDNSALEYDTSCNDWHYVSIGKDYQLDCVPELVALKKPEILFALKDLIK